MCKENELPDECGQSQETAPHGVDVERLVMPDVSELRKAAKCVFLATEEDIAHDLSDKLNRAANTIEELQDFAIWMTGCGYDFCQHDYFCKQRDKLLKA